MLVVAKTSDHADSEHLGWAVTANVSAETGHGLGGKSVASGLRHFSPGTKVWVLPAQWGDGREQALVVGRHRGSRRFARLVVVLAHLEDFRVESIYSPAVARQLKRPIDRDRGQPAQWGSRAEAEASI